MSADDREHKYSDQILDTICVLSIHAELRYPAIYHLFLAGGSVGFSKKSIDHKVRKLSATLSPSEQARLKYPMQPDPRWIQWQVQSIRSLPVQAILRNNGIRDPPGWRSQTREDYLVVLMLHSEMSSAEIAVELNRKFGGRMEADGSSVGLYIGAIVDAWYFSSPEGSYQWWTSGLEESSVRDDILRDCGVKVEAGGIEGSGGEGI